MPAVECTSYFPIGRLQNIFSEEPLESHVLCQYMPLIKCKIKDSFHVDYKMKLLFSLIALLITLTACQNTISTLSQETDQRVIWPEGRKIAVSLSYDDALNSQLDKALPALDKHKFKASFYVLANSDVMNTRMQ